MNRLFSFALASLLLLTACEQKKTDPNDDEYGAPKADKKIAFTLLSHQFTYNKDSEENPEVDIISTSENSWIFQFNAYNAQTKTAAFLNYIVDDFVHINTATSQATVDYATLHLGSEMENPPFPMESNYDRGTAQISITKSEYVKSAGAMGIYYDYYLVSGTFSGTFTDILGENEVTIQSATFTDLVLMHLKVSQ